MAHVMEVVSFYEKEVPDEIISFFSEEQITYYDKNLKEHLFSKDVLEYCKIDYIPSNIVEWIANVKLNYPTAAYFRFEKI
jgi:hypothetical protein